VHCRMYLAIVEGNIYIHIHLGDTLTVQPTFKKRIRRELQACVF
jgi:hypothetical protein